MFQNVVQAVRREKLAERTGILLENGKGKMDIGSGAEPTGEMRRHVRIFA
jgi:hypothetical protein